MGQFYPKLSGAGNVIVSWSKGTALRVKSKWEGLKYTIPRNRLKTFSWI